MSKAQSKQSTKFKIDQHGQPVPPDLVLLDDPSQFTNEELISIDKLDWYEPRGVRDSVFISAAAIKKLFADSDFEFQGPAEFGFDDCEWSKIAPAVHRWDENRFYHV